MASSRRIAHVSRELLNKLVATVTDASTPAPSRLDRASASLERLVRDAESPAAGARHAVVGALDDAISTASELARAGTPRADIETRVRAKLIEALREVHGVSVEGSR